MKKPFFAPLVVLLASGAAFYAGRRATIASIKNQLSANVANTLPQGASLADIFPPSERAAASACFLEGAETASRFEDFAWAPPAVPAPFVGFGPRPGKHLNAVVTPLLLRAERDPVLPKPPGRKRIVLVGGSVAFGSGAPSQDRTIAGYLEKQGAEVFTLAYPWWTSTHERILIENRVAALEPDLVLVLSGLNDAVAAAKGQDVRWMRTPVEDSFVERLSEDHELAGLPPLVDLAPRGATAPSPEAVAERLKANVLLEARAVPQIRFLLQPCIFTGKKPRTPRESAIVEKNKPEKREYFEKCWAEIRLSLGGTGVFSDLSDVFDATKEDVFLDMGHFADRGNELVAKRILGLVH